MTRAMQPAHRPPHFGPTVRPTPARPTPRHPHVALPLLLVVALTGCLFPAVDTGDTNDDPDRMFVDPGAEGFVTRTGQQVRDGTLGPALRINDAGVGAEALDQDFALPPRVTALRVMLDWVDQDDTGTNQTQRLHDLDLQVVVEHLTESGARVVWGPRSDDGGGPGAPDAPVVVASDEDDRLAVDDQTTLTATITPESSGGGVRWVCTVTYEHLVPGRT